MGMVCAMDGVVPAANHTATATVNCKNIFITHGLYKVQLQQPQGSYDTGNVKMYCMGNVFERKDYAFLYEKE